MSYSMNVVVGDESIHNELRCFEADHPNCTEKLGYSPLSRFILTEREACVATNGLLSRLCENSRFPQKINDGVIEDARGFVYRFLQALDSHFESTKNTINECNQLVSGLKQKDFALQEIRKPYSCAVNSVKHNGGIVEFVQYSAPSVIPVRGFFIAREYSPMKFGPDPSVHCGRTAWSFNRLIPATICALAHTRKVLQRTLSKNSRGGGLSKNSILWKLASDVSQLGVSCFEDEVRLPQPLVRLTTRSADFSISSLVTSRKSFVYRGKETAVRYETTAHHVLPNLQIDLPYFVGNNAQHAF